MSALQCQCKSDLLVANMLVKYLFLSQNSYFLANINSKLMVFDIKNKHKPEIPLRNSIMDIQFYFDTVHVLYEDREVEVMETKELKTLYKVRDVEALYTNEKLSLELFLTESRILKRDRNTDGIKSVSLLAGEFQKSPNLSIVSLYDESKTNILVYVLNENTLGVYNITTQTPPFSLDLASESFLKILKIDQSPMLINNRLQLFEIDNEYALGAPSSVISDIVDSKEQVFETFQLVATEQFQMLALYSKAKQTFYDISFIGKKVNLLRKFKIGINISCFKYGTNNNVGLFIFNSQNNVNTIKLGEKELMKSAAIESRQREGERIRQEEMKGKEVEVKKTKVLQRESKTIKPSSEPVANPSKIWDQSKSALNNPMLRKTADEQIKKQQISTGNPFVKQRDSNPDSNPNSRAGVNLSNPFMKYSFSDPRTILTQPQILTVFANPSNSGPNPFIVPKMKQESFRQAEKPIQEERIPQIPEKQKETKSNQPGIPIQSNKDIEQKQELNLKSNKALSAFSESLKQRLINTTKQFKQALQSQGRKIEESLKSTTTSLKQTLQKEIIQQTKSQITDYITTDLHNKLQKYFKQVFLKVNQTYQVGHRFAQQQLVSKKQGFEKLSIQLVDKRFQSLENLIQSIKEFLESKEIKSEDISGFESKVEQIGLDLKNSLGNYNDATHSREKIDSLLEIKVGQLTKVFEELKLREEETQSKQKNRKRTDSVGSINDSKEPKKYFILRKKD